MSDKFSFITSGKSPIYFILYRLFLHPRKSCFYFTWNRGSEKKIKN